MPQGGVYGGEFPPEYELYVTGELDEEAVGAYTCQLFEWDQEAPEANWRIIINCPGGETESGTSLFETIRAYSKRGGGTHFITTVASGQCSSMATLVSQAGDWRVTGELTIWLFHMPMVGNLEGKPIDEMQTEIKMLREWENAACEIMLERTTIDLISYNAQIATGPWYVMGKELLELGFVDEVR